MTTLTAEKALGIMRGLNTKNKFGTVLRLPKI